MNKYTNPVRLESFRDTNTSIQLHIRMECMHPAPKRQMVTYMLPPQHQICSRDWRIAFSIFEMCTRLVRCIHKSWLGKRTHCYIGHSLFALFGWLAGWFPMVLKISMAIWSFGTLKNDFGGGGGYMFFEGSKSCQAAATTIRRALS